MGARELAQVQEKAWVVDGNDRRLPLYLGGGRLIILYLIYLYMIILEYITVTTHHSHAAALRKYIQLRAKKNKVRGTKYA